MKFEDSGPSQPVRNSGVGLNAHCQLQLKHKNPRSARLNRMVTVANVLGHDDTGEMRAGSTLSCAQGDTVRYLLVIHLELVGKAQRTPMRGQVEPSVRTCRLLT